MFWPGVAAAIWVGYRVARKRSAGEVFLLASVLALYLPWFALPRIKYFYYLLPVLPLLAAAAGGGLLRLLPQPGLPLTRPARYRLLLVVAHLGLALAFWAGSFPAVTGMWRREPRFPRSSPSFRQAFAPTPHQIDIWLNQGDTS